MVRASLFGDDMLTNAFYGEDGVGQILRERTTFEIRNMNSGANIAENADPVADAAPQADEAQDIDAPQSEFQQGDHFTNIRQMLEDMEEFDAEDSEDGAATTEEQFHNLYDQFEDVLIYHEQRKDKLRAALLA